MDFPNVVDLTSSGRGAIATRLVEGPGALAAVEAAFRPTGGTPLGGLPADRLAFGHFGPEPGEEVVVRVRSEQSVELHCHGGRAAVAMVEQVLREQGCRPLAWQQWIQDRTEDPIRAAALLALAEARTERTAAILLAQYEGALARAIDQACRHLEGNDLDAAGRLLDDLTSRARAGLHLIEPWRVVLAGPPNAGKSTLLNAMVGYSRAIVDPQAGTTRDLVTALTVLDGWPVELCDTAGLREAGDPVERAGVDAAQRSLAAADLVLLIVDLSQPWSAVNESLLAAHPEAIVVHNKADLAAGPASARPAGYRTSALNKVGIEDLLNAIAARLVPRAPDLDAAVPFTPDQVAALRDATLHARQGDARAAAARLRSLRT